MPRDVNDGRGRPVGLRLKYLWPTGPRRHDRQDGLHEGGSRGAWRSLHRHVGTGEEEEEEDALTPKLKRNASFNTHTALQNRNSARPQHMSSHFDSPPQGSRMQTPFAPWEGSLGHRNETPVL